MAGSEEIAAFVAFLLGDEASSVTGAALAIDGGATAGWTRGSVQIWRRYEEHWSEGHDR